jgi:hypothetical protein
MYGRLRQSKIYAGNNALKKICREVCDVILARPQKNSHPPLAINYIYGLP